MLVHAGFIVVEVALDKFFSELFCSPLSASFHWCYITIQHLGDEQGPLVGNNNNIMLYYKHKIKKEFTKIL
jgi:hypothetical protein